MRFTFLGSQDTKDKDYQTKLTIIPEKNPSKHFLKHKNKYQISQGKNLSLNSQFFISQNLAEKMTPKKYPHSLFQIQEML